MSNLLALVLGVLFLVLWVCVWVYGSALDQVYELGREDYSHRRKRRTHYRGLARIAYLRGRRHEAYTGNEKLKNRLKGRRLTF